MKHKGHNRRTYHLLMTGAILLIVISVITLAHIFKQYNELSLQRQDRQLEGMAQAADAGMANYLIGFREELRYVIGRRGVLTAEATWYETGSTDDLLSRMQENLVIGNPLIHNMLAIQEDAVFLSAVAGQEYYFPNGMEGELQPCFAGNGSMYLALIEEGQHARYAVLLSMYDWYEALSATYANEDLHLMLLGSQMRILLHTWQGQLYVNDLSDLSQSNCDTEAVRHMVECRNTGKRLTISYSLPEPGTNHVHEMRMTALPVSECTNGYFLVSLSSDYDEILQPMQAVVLGLIFIGALLVSGVLLLILTAVLLFRQNRHRDRELERLIHRSAETQKLLEKTTELAHHQRLQTIGTLTASIAHEFNNLLTPIMGYSILTLEGLPEDCDDLADNVAEIYTASCKAKEMISRLNALSRKNEEAILRRLSLRSIAEKALQVAAPAQPLNVTTQLVNEGDACFISGNETQLSQLLLNLILNAYHAMEAAGGVLTLTVRQEGEQAVVQVKDEGAGIPEDVLPRIFEPFFTTKGTGRGTGLGLAIVQQVAENHHGSIEVQSSPGQGSTFTLRIPLADSAGPDIS